jgi:pectinesterase
MYTPAFKVSRSRPLFLGFCASACGALCLATSACGGGNSPSTTPNDPTGTAGSAGSGVAAGGMNPGGGTTAGGTASSGASSTAGSAGVSAGGAGTAGTGGTSATAGAAGAGGAAGGSAGSGAGGAPIVVGGTAARPQLSADQAANFTILKYLEKKGTVTAPTADPWDPTAGVGDVTALTPKFTVAASGGTDTTVQSAIDKAVALGGTERIAIEIAAGTYREVVCVPSSAPPITLYSKSTDASATRIVFNNYNGKTKDAQTPANPCNPAIGSTTYGTSGSPTVAVYANAFYAKNLTIENDTDETGIASNVQAVALGTQGDKQIYENVRLLGNQDTFFVKSSSVDVIARVFVTKSFIQGDTDFIFGRGVLVIDQTEIRFISSRQGSKGYAIVPSTDARNPYGILVNKCNFTADAATTAGSIHLGRAWDESGKDLATYATLVTSGVYPNGQALIRESTLGAHIQVAGPWSVAATTSRPFSSAAGTYPANRLYEFGNTGPGAAK